MANSGLRRRINIRIVLVSFIAILIMAGISAACAMQVSDTQKSAAVENKVAECSEQLDGWLAQRIAVSSFMTDEIVDRGYDTDPAACAAFLADAIPRDSQIFDYYIGYADTTCVFGGGWEPAPGEYDPTTRQWYKDAVSADGIIISDPYTDAETGRLVITCAKKITKGSDVIGVFATDIFLDEINGIVAGLKADENGYAVLLTESGDIMFHEEASYLPTLDEDENDKFTNFSDVSSFDPATEEKTVVTLKDYNGKNEKFCYVSLKNASWKVGYVLDGKEFHNMFLIFVGILAAVAIVLSFIIMIIMRIVLEKEFKPLVRITEKSTEIAEGNLSVSFDYSYDDEIGNLCRVIENNNRSIKGYIDDISYRLNSISKGDFSAESSVDYIGDYTSIKQSLDSISHSLGTVFSGISNASSAVTGGAGGLANGATQLAESVSKQTELITEIVGKVDMVSGKISDNVSYTENARNIARKTGDVVKTSSEHMDRLLEAMKEISESSDEIKKIIGTIEDIAFQTNILALNASVEAARAGSAGKGFAVVADEVRNLAGKSSQASERTAALIRQSVDAVNNGMKYADETAQSLHSVVEQTEEIDRIIVKINEESYSQKECMDEVNSDISLISDYVTSSAANAEESAAASEELNGQAASLRSMLRSFGM